MNRELSANTTLSHYRIVEKLGAGGMGEVYLAEDTRLERRVALKLLPAEFTADADRVRRFMQEARAASALNHPNIIAKALSAAHSAGITHRDIKPDNIMVRDDGYVKVLDFGLARLRSSTESDPEAATLAHQTVEGRVLGTVAYMSPEQARGETVHHPSDVFALGIVLYELATGRHPFRSETLLGYLHAITSHTPVPLTHLKPAIPAALNVLILRMLDKEASLRPSAGEVAEVLLNELQTQNTSPPPSIAVLPFVNISNDPDNEYFCDGLAQELLNALSKVEALRVAARTSAFFFKGKDIDVREVGQKLNVATVLEGSVRKAGNRLRITAQLVNVANGYHLWSERYDRQMEDIFDIQDEISLSIVAALKLKLLGSEKSAVVKRYTDNTEVFQLYLKGRFFVNRRTSESLWKAIEYFNQAVSLDSNYALAYAGLADAYLVLGIPDAITDALSPQDSLPKARAAAEKALEIDNSVGEIYAALAHIKWKERDWAGAEGDYHRSIKLTPNYPIAHFYYAIYLASLGRQDEALKEIRRAQELDPLSLPINASVTYVLYLGRQYDAAIEAGRKTLEMDAAFALTHQRLGLAYVQKKMYREAITEFQLAADNSNRAPLAIVSLGHAYAVSGNTVEAEKVLAELKDLSQRRYISSYGVAIIYLGLGDQKQAFQWLEWALEENNTELTFLKVDPRLDPLRSDPRFRQLLQEARFTR